jgi:hypothetical protein
MAAREEEGRENQASDCFAYTRYSTVSQATPRPQETPRDAYPTEAG